MRVVNKSIISPVVFTLISTSQDVSTSAFTLSMTKNDAILAPKDLPSSDKKQNDAPTRRTFFSNVATVGMAAATTGAVHSLECACRGCTSSFLPKVFGIPPAMAFDRDVGGENASAETQAQNAQAKLTNARLEASGFKLDTREEEAAKISEGLASFSYDAATSNKAKSKDTGKGYGAKTSKN